MYNTLRPIKCQGFFETFFDFFLKIFFIAIFDAKATVF